MSVIVRFVVTACKMCHQTLLWHVSPCILCLWHVSPCILCLWRVIIHTLFVVCHRNTMFVVSHILCLWHVSPCILCLWCIAVRTLFPRSQWWMMPSWLSMESSLSNVFSDALLCNKQTDTNNEILYNISYLSFTKMITLLETLVGAPAFCSYTHIHQSLVAVVWSVGSHHIPVRPTDTNQHKHRHGLIHFCKELSYASYTCNYKQYRSTLKKAIINSPTTTGYWVFYQKNITISTGFYNFCWKNKSYCIIKQSKIEIF